MRRMSGLIWRVRLAAATPSRSARVDQHHVSLQGRAQRHQLRQIRAHLDYRDRGIAFKELGETFAQEAHFGDDHDAQTPCFDAEPGAARREVRVRGKSFPSITAKVRP